MNKTRIDWCDMSWNPVTGCLYGCEYCYAKRIANRFGGNLLEWPKYVNESGIYTLDHPICDEATERIIPYPYRFEPTFHKSRLDEPKRKAKPQIIFVGSMTDLFGEWVPDKWIQEVFKSCKEAPQHTYLFLTKNPARFQNTLLTQKLNITSSMWFGFSVVDQKQLDVLAMGAKWLPANSFISIEPLHDAISLTRINPVGVSAVLDFTNGGQYWFMGGDDKGKRLKWVIIGAETGNRKDKIIPKREWIERIVDQCKVANIPVFMKESLRDLMGQDFIQEWPEGMKLKA